MLCDEYSSGLPNAASQKGIAEPNSAQAPPLEKKPKKLMQRKMTCQRHALRQAMREASLFLGGWPIMGAWAIQRGSNFCGSDTRVRG